MTYGRGRCPCERLCVCVCVWSIKIRLVPRDLQQLQKVMIMRVLVSLVPFVLMVWSGQETTALPIEDNLGLLRNQVS